MGLNNSDTISGHVGIAAYWSGGHHHAPRRMNTIPLPVPQLGHWMDELFKRPQGRAGKIEYTPMMSKKIDTITPGTEGAKKLNKSSYSNAIKPGDYAAKVWKALTNYGFPGNSIDFVYTMCYMESGHWTNGPALKDNNPANIMWYKGKVKGTFIQDNGTYAIHFKNLDEFAAELYKTLSKGSNPLGATTLEDYVHRLAINNYFGEESESSYLEKMKDAQGALDSDNSKYQDLYTKKEIEKAHPDGILAWMKAHPVITGIGLAAVGLVVIKSVLK